MGNCVDNCLNPPPPRRRYQHQHQLVHGGGGGGYVVSPDQSRPPTFHHTQFRQLTADERYETPQQPLRSHGGAATAAAGLSGESTRVVAVGDSATTPHREWPGSASGLPSNSTSSRRTPPPGQSPLPVAAAATTIGAAPVHSDLAVVVRQGTNEKSTLIRTPRSSLTGGRSTGGAGAGAGGITPKAGAAALGNSGGRSTPRAGAAGRVENDPYDDGAASEGGGDDEMVLVCADCFVDIMGVEEGKAPSRCPVTGKMHI